MKRAADRTGPHEEAVPPGLPSLRFYYSRALRTKTLKVLDALEAAEDATNHCDQLAEIVLDLTETGLDYYFLKPVQEAKAGLVASQTTKMGLGGIRRLMGPVARRVLGSMDSDQLLVVGQHIRALMT